MSRRRKIHKKCLKCNRPLRDRESQLRGYGPVCFDASPQAQFVALEAEGQIPFPADLLGIKLQSAAAARAADRRRMIPREAR